MMLWRKKRHGAILACCLVFISFVAVNDCTAGQPSTGPTWRFLGPGDCREHDVDRTLGSAEPDPSRCSARSKAKIAVCWSNRWPFSPGCTYKDLPADKCVGGPSPGNFYVCADSHTVITRTFTITPMTDVPPSAVITQPSGKMPVSDWFARNLHGTVNIVCAPENPGDPAYKKTKCDGSPTEHNGKQAWKKFMTGPSVSFTVEFSGNPTLTFCFRATTSTCVSTPALGNNKLEMNVPFLLLNHH